jgi:heptosyltransferase II
MRTKKSILILKLGAIGDVVMALSLITAIDEKYPDAEITWICGKTVAPILDSINRINKLIIVDETALYKGSLFEKIYTVAGIWIRILGRKFDFVINCYRDPRYKLLLPVRSLSYTHFGGRGYSNSFIPGRYHSDEYSRMIMGKNDYSMKPSTLPRPRFPDSPVLSGYLKTFPVNGILLAPGGTRNILRNDGVRRWPIEKYVELAGRLLLLKYEVIIIGAESDNWVSDAFSKIGVLNAIGKTDLIELTSLLRISSLLITHDTGTLHIGKLSGIKTIALFGPVNPGERVGVNEKIEVLWGGADLPCSPCYNGTEFAECVNNICMKNISVDSVMELIKTLPRQ